MLETRITAGLVNWPQLAQIAGLPAEGWTPQLLGARRDARGDRMVLALLHSGHAEVILKQAFTPADIAATARAISAQTRAFTLLADHPQARVPRILAALPTLGAIAMERVPGKQLAEIVETGEIAPAVTRAGRWSAAFHATGPVESRAFQPRFVIDHLTRAAALVRGGQRKIARSGRFLACVERLQKEARLTKGAPTRATARHGDLNAGNLMLADQGDLVWGFDFSDPLIRPVGFDIARLLVSLAECAPIPAGGPVVPDTILRAFFAGYDLIDAEDATIGFLCRARLLSNWLGLAHSEREMSIPQTIRFQRILALAEAGILERA